MSRAAQEMQRIADEMKKARRQPTKKGRDAVDHELEDVTEEQPAAPASEPEPQAAPAAAAEEQTMAKTSAQRSKEWRDKQKKNKKGGARKAKAARAPRARTAAPAAGDRASVKALGSGEVKTVFITTTVALAKQAFTMLLDHSESQRTAAAGTDQEAAWTAQANQLQKIVTRLG